MSLGSQLAAGRKSKKLTQGDVAQALGVSVQAVSQWERDKTLPGSLNLMKLAHLLDLNFDNSKVELRELANAPPVGVTAPIIDSFPTIHFGKNRADGDEGEWFEWDFGPGFSEVDRLTVNWEPAGSIFAIRMDDRSMAPEFLPDDLLIFDAGLDPEPGDFVLAQVFPSEGGIFRKYRLRSIATDGVATIDLVPMNPDFPTLTIIDGKDGEVTACLREHRRIYKHE